MEEVSSKEICPADYEDKLNEKKEAYFPTHEMLIKNRFEIISEGQPTIFWKAGEKYCQGNIIQNIIIERGRKQNGVYLIAVRDTDLYKIGITKDIEKRLSQLQTSNPYEFYLMGFFVTEKCRKLESLLHQKLRLNRYKREWFKLAPENVRDISRFARNFISKPITENNKDIGHVFNIDIGLRTDQYEEVNGLPF